MKTNLNNKYKDRSLEETIKIIKNFFKGKKCNIISCQKDLINFYLLKAIFINSLIEVYSSNNYTNFIQLFLK